MTKEKDVIIAFRAPSTLKDIVKELIQKDMHLNQSELCRNATRHKVFRKRKY